MKIENIQYMRALAAMLVIFIHASHQVVEYSFYVAPFGSIGVDLFFIISGFIMVWISKEDDSPASFLGRRIGRIAPLYWVITLAMSSIVFIFPELFKTAAFDLIHIGKSLFFIPHYHPKDLHNIRPMLGPGWTLNYEMYFYLVFSISLFFAPRYRIYFIAFAITALFSISSSIDSSNSAVLTFLSNSIVFEFVAGAIAGKVFLSGLRLNQLTSLLLIASSLALNLLLSDLPRGITNGVPALLLFLGCLHLKLPSMKFLHTLGDASYSIYLTHLFPLGFLRATLPNILGYNLGASIVFVLLSYLASITFGLLVYRYIERGLLIQIRHWHKPNNA